MDIKSLTEANSQSDLIAMAEALHTDLGSTSPAYKHWSKDRIAGAIMDMQWKENTAPEQVDAVDPMDAFQEQSQAELADAIVQEVIEEVIEEAQAEIEELIVGSPISSSTVTNMKSLRAKIRKMVDIALDNPGPSSEAEFNDRVSIQIFIDNEDKALHFHISTIPTDDFETVVIYSSTDQRDFYKALGTALELIAPTPPSTEE